MIDLSTRHRPMVLLASVLLAQVLLLAFQVKRERDVRLIRVWSVEIAAPVERGATWAVGGAGRIWHGYVDLRHTRTENGQLHAELDELRMANAQLESKAADDARLGTLLGFREANAAVPMLAVRVIAGSSDAVGHALLINRGEKDGVRKNMGAITPEGVVGKIIRVYANTAQVLLIDDSESGVGALLQGTRTHGVVRGQGGPNLRMDYVINDEAVHDGETVLTSGDDRIFPKDLPIGWITGVETGNPFKVILLKPAARLDRLEELFVLLSQQELPSAGEKEISAEAIFAPQTQTRGTTTGPNARTTALPGGTLGTGQSIAPVSPQASGATFAGAKVPNHRPGGSAAPPMGNAAPPKVSPAAAPAAPGNELPQ
jgi:rod shape-determining protein MreC